MQNPKCQDAAVTTEMETPVAIVIGAYDPYNVPFTFSIVDQPTDGSVTIEMANVDFGAGTLSNPVFSYTPNAGFAGVDTFTYTATNDNGVVGNTATITITIPTQIPSATSFSVSTGMDSPVVVNLSATDPNNLPLTYSISNNPTQGSVSESSGVYTYTPNNDYIGSDSFTYTASNGTYTSSNATVSITINSRTPVANDYDASTSINLPIELSFNATDPYDLPLTYSIATNPTDGSVAESNGVWTYTPAQDYSGVVSFTYTASNGTFTSSAANVNITID